MLGACYVKSSVLGVACLCKIWKEVSPPEPLRLQENHEHSLTKLPPKGMRRELSMPLSSQPQHHKTHLYSFHSLYTVPLSALPAFTCYDIHQVDLCSLGSREVGEDALPTASSLERVTKDISHHSCFFYFLADVVSMNALFQPLSPWRAEYLHRCSEISIALFIQRCVSWPPARNNFHSSLITGSWFFFRITLSFREHSQEILCSTLPLLSSHS